MKTLKIYVLIALSVTLMMSSCKKEKEEDAIIISDAKSLNDNLHIEGAIRVKGNIPEPIDGIYGGNLEGLTSDVVMSDANPSLEIEFQYPDSEKIVFFKIDGTDDYFEFTMNNEGKTNQKMIDVNNRFMMLCCIPPHCNVKFKNSPKFLAKVQTCKLQKGKTKAESLADKRNWCPPRKINIQTFGEVKIGDGYFVYKGATTKGLCVGVPATQCSTGLDVTIINTDVSLYFIIYNIPSASSGTFPFTGFEGDGCNLFALGNIDGNLGLDGFGGSLTKTGAKSFVFSYKEESKIITGAGSY